jgi:hypothetical protein
VWLDRSVPKQVISKIERGDRTLDVDEIVVTAYVLEMSVVDLLAMPGDVDANAEVDLPGFRLTVGELRATVTGREEAARREELTRQAVEAVARAVEAAAHFPGLSVSASRGPAPPRAKRRGKR